MAQKVEVIVTDDITGEEGAVTQTFSHNGNLFEIDLAKKKRDELTEALAPFVAHARRASPENRRAFTTAATRGNGTRGGGTPRNRERSSDIRAWCRKKGYKVSDRGRIPAEYITEYDAEFNHTGQL